MIWVKRPAEHACASEILFTNQIFMKLTYQAVLLSAIGLGLGSCSIDTPWTETGTGGISLRLSASADVTDAIPVLRGEAPSLEAPETEAFSIKLTNIATGETKTWATLADFQNQKSFATGSYTLTAFYGDPDEEGFEKSYFEGSAEVQVLEARESEASVIAQLANSMVSVDYTDAFRAYFKDYAVTVHSDGHSYVEFEKNETRPAFIAPGEVSISVNLTNPSGKSVTLQPAAFPASARYHYHITFDVNSSPTGDAQLQIVFDDSVQTEDVAIDLTDELFSSPAPSVTPVGFTDGQTLEQLSGSASSDPLKFDVIARGGISSAKLTISGDGLTLPFGNEVELVNASAAVQDQLKTYGITAIGLFKNPSTLASVDISGLPAHLPDGKYSVSLVVKDPYTRISDPVTLNISTVPVELSAQDGTAVAGAGDAVIEVAYNGMDPEKNISFRALSKAGVYKDCEIVSVDEAADTRSFETKNYIFSIKLPDTEHENIPVKVFFNGTERLQVNVKVIVPKYSVDVDAFATYAKVRINPETESEKALVTNNVKLWLDGLAQSDVNRNPDSGMITINGLTPSQAYTLGHSILGLSSAKNENFTTEEDIALTNGDFASQHNTIKNDKFQVGGGCTGAFSIVYTNKVKLSVNEPQGWASVNPKTYYTGASAINSWFTVVSTFMEGNTAVLRSVGYSHNGIVPPNTKVQNTLRRPYYNTNVPEISSKAAGELFLGTYAYNGSEDRAEGIDFTSRPKSLTFDYSYTPYGVDSGVVNIEVLDKQGQIISSERRILPVAGAMQNVTVAIPYKDFGRKASRIRLGFKSSEADFALHTPTGSELEESYKDGNTGMPITPYESWMPDNTFHTFSSGSVLKIANVKFNY